jgi:ABC-2 type transport system permease protein
MSIFIVVRHTRADEESGRLELVGSAVVGRHAALACAMLISLGANVAIGAVMTVAAVALGLPLAGTLVMAAGIMGCGVAFTGVAAVTAQVAQTARSARGLAIMVLGVAFLLRAVGDSVSATSPRWLTWLSPMGWAEVTRAFGQARTVAPCPVGVILSARLLACVASDSPRPWVLALPVLAAVLLAAVAAVLAVRRDYGAGMLPQRSGRPAAVPSLRTPLALAWRLHRSSVIAWLCGGLVFGFVFGSATKGIGGLLTSAQIKKAVLRMGGRAAAALLSNQSQLDDAFLAAILSFAGLAVAGYAIATMLRLRTEETEERADPVLATGAGRIGWGLSHALIAAVGTLAILVVIGVGAGLGLMARSVGGSGEIATMVGASLAQAPAVVVLAGLAAALFGLAPKASVGVSWSVLGLAVLVLVLGATLQLSHWALDISPFTHVPRLPGGTVTVAPMVWLSAVAVALACAGLAGLRHRDIENAG